MVQRQVLGHSALVHDPLNRAAYFEYGAYRMRSLVGRRPQFSLPDSLHYCLFDSKARQPASAQKLKIPLLCSGSTTRYEMIFVAVIDRTISINYHSEP